MFKGLHAGTPTKSRTTCELLMVMNNSGIKGQISLHYLLKGEMRHIDASQSRAVEDVSVPLLLGVLHNVDENTIVSPSPWVINIFDPPTPPPTVTVVLFPKWASAKVKKISQGFVWNGDDSETAGGTRSLVNWKIVFHPKALGGLGIADLDRFGRALRLRWLLRFLHGR